MEEGFQVLVHLVCYFSKKFLKHQLNYSAIEKGALALLMALKRFEVYLRNTLTLVGYIRTITR